jgi:hypothetical protein
MIRPLDGKHVPSENFAAAILLEELWIQCLLFERNVDRLEDGADHWMKQSIGQDFGRSVPPIDMLAWATVCLSSMAAIRRLLVADGKSPKAIKRRAVLYDFLGRPPLPIIGSPTVRNSWEHLDERLDDILPTMRSGAISQIDVFAKDVAPGTIALKRIDPRTLMVSFSTEAIQLRPARSEVAEISRRVELAKVRLTTELVDLWR